MELIKTVKAIGSFFLALLIVAIPFMCALSFALNWYSLIRFMFTVMTVALVAIGTAWIYIESEEV